MRPSCQSSNTWVLHNLAMPPFWSMLPLSSSAIRLFSETLPCLQMTPKIFAPLCVKTLPTPQKGDSELGKFRIFYLSVLPAPAINLHRVESSFTGSWGCPTSDTAGTYIKWLSER